MTGKQTLERSMDLSGRMPRKKWRYRRMEVLIRDGYTCQDCGAVGGPDGDTQLHVHHVTPVSKGGSDEKDNLATLCKRCHFERHYEEFIAADYSLDEVEEALEHHFTRQPVITTADLAEALGCTRETARVKLNTLADEGQLEAQKVGSSAKIWYPTREAWPEFWERHDAVVEQMPDAPGQNGRGRSDTSDSSAPDQPLSATKQTADERVLFFPSRREIVVDNPTPRTRQVLAQTSHLVDSTSSGYLYKVAPEDIWTAPYDAFDDLRDDLQEVVGEERWDGGFESRIKDDWDRAHQFRLWTHPDGYTVLEGEDQNVYENVAKRKLEHNTHYTQFVGDTQMRLKHGAEAKVKERLYDEGYPVLDERDIEEGAPLDVRLGDEWELRDYQQEWVEHFAARRSGVFCGPSGAGKTVAAVGAMEEIGGETLIIVPSRELAQQWEGELLEKTNLRAHQIGQYHGGEKNIRPVTIATYDTAAMSRHRKLFRERDWGLIIADECHHAVANTWKRFREIQSTARLGLSATPVRESGDAKEIYTLIGPPIGTDWGTLFANDWVAKPAVEIVMVPWGSEQARKRYRRAEGNAKLIEAARNPAKADVIQALLADHAAEGQKALVFVDWIKQGEALADALGLPFIYGETSHAQREELYQQFRDGELRALIVSRVGDEGIDLPDAEVAILASTMGSSRSQTGQRAGRTMRPFGDAQVYVLLTKGSGEEDWGRESTQYLAEKGIDITRTEWED